MKAHMLQVSKAANVKGLLFLTRSEVFMLKIEY